MCAVEIGIARIDSIISYIFMDVLYMLGLIYREILTLKQVRAVNIYIYICSMDKVRIYYIVIHPTVWKMCFVV